MNISDYQDAISTAEVAMLDAKQAADSEGRQAIRLQGQINQIAETKSALTLTAETLCDGSLDSQIGAMTEAISQLRTRAAQHRSAQEGFLTEFSEHKATAAALKARLHRHRRSEAAKFEAMKDMATEELIHALINMGAIISGADAMPPESLATDGIIRVALKKPGNTGGLRLGTRIRIRADELRASFE